MGPTTNLPGREVRCGTAHDARRRALVEGVKQRRPSLESLFDGGCDTQPLAYWACFDCGWTGAVHDLDHCDMCNVVTDTGDEGMSICEECFASRLSKD